MYILYISVLYILYIYIYINFMPVGFCTPYSPVVWANNCSNNGE